jgi:phage terminase small subunit
VAELAKIAFGDLRDLFDGSRLRLPGDLSDDAAARIASIEGVTRPGAPDENGPTVEYVHKVRAWDKIAALTQLGRHLGMFREKPDDQRNITVIISGTDAAL